MYVRTFGGSALGQIENYEEIKLVSQVQLLLSMFLWRHSKKSCYLEYYELVLGVQKTEIKILKILQNSKMLKICQKSICQNYFLDKKYFAFLGRPFYDHRSLHAENFGVQTYL